ncbi:glutathione S-transferase family protein [Sphingomonas yunnanensis]|uniref:glutathione S-transferase family protein n=1 Tax=Sphingomonas yunnanensis TaxID=310400 RepID=UPI001CA71D75|nr:glutathione S-transferase family protein [Sphingomonas yunnanensis]MBY9064746.1 glutathione S-transferase family protein [Sphingomonas yunnanensis]
MLTLFHAPRSRSTRIIWLLEELGVPYQLRYVTIRYRDGSGEGPDAANPHPDKKVPALLDDDVLVTESAAVATYLADQADGAGLSPWIGDRDRGAYLTWLSWTEGEFGPAIGARFGAPAGETPPAFAAALARVERALSDGPWLLGERFSAADVMLGGTLGWAQQLIPSDGVIPAYLARLTQRPGFQRAMARDAVPA